MAIETGTDKNAIGRVKHHKAGAARAENGPVVYKKVGKVAKTCRHVHYNMHNTSTVQNIAINCNWYWKD